MRHFAACVQQSLQDSRILDLEPVANRLQSSARHMIAARLLMGTYFATLSA
jgi:hypothetical protein